MSQLEQDATTVGAGSTEAAAPDGLGAPSPPRGRAESVLEPELEGSTYQTAPITSLALARWTWAVTGLLLGASLGVLASLGSGYQATAEVRFTAADGSDADATGTTLETQAASDGVLASAVATLRKDPRYQRNGGLLPARDVSNAENPAIRYLRGGLKALYINNTNFVEITVTRPNGRVAIFEANAIAAAVRTRIENEADTDIRAQRSELAALLSPGSGPLTTAGPDPTKIREYFGQRIATIADSKHNVKSTPAPEAVPAGPSREVTGLLGASGGAFLGALAAVAAGAGRRRPHSPRELASLAPDLVVRTTVQAGELAGRVMETERRSVVVLAMPHTPFAATQLGLAVAHHLRTHGATVALVDRVCEFSPTTTSEDRLWALRRDVRRNIPANFSADMLVVVCGADEEALSLIAGQSDLLVAVVAKQRKTILADLRRTVDAVRICEPVVVLAR